MLQILTKQSLVNTACSDCNELIGNKMNKIDIRKISLILSILGLLTACTGTSATASSETLLTSALKDEYKVPKLGFNTPLTSFTPPKGLTITREITMLAEKHEIGYMKSVRSVDDSANSILIKDKRESKIGVAVGIDVDVKETVWSDTKGLFRYQGEYDETLRSDLMKINAIRKNGVLNFAYKPHGKEEFVNQNLIPNKDYNWTTLFFEFRNRELQPGKLYNRMLLDVVVGESKPVKEMYLGMKEYKIGEHVLDCHVIWLDYGHVDAIIWVAEDELGPFLVYEKAIATEGTFELILSKYKKTQR